MRTAPTKKEVDMLFRRKSQPVLKSAEVLRAEENMRRLAEMKKIPVDPRVNESGLERARRALRGQELVA